MSDKPAHAGLHEVPDVGELLRAAPQRRAQLARQHAGGAPGLPRPVCQIRLTDDEGGLNLNMPPKLWSGLIERGQDAGAEVTNPKSFDWNRHRSRGSGSMMQMLQRSLGQLGFGRPGVYEGEYPGRIAFRTVVREWEESGETPVPPALAWWMTAIPASNAVYELVEAWPDFDADAPTPKPTLRIVPRA